MTSPSMIPEVPVSQMPGVVAEGNPNAMGLVLNRASMPPYGATFWPPLPATVPARPAWVIGGPAGIWDPQLEDFLLRVKREL